MSVPNTSKKQPPSKRVALYRKRAARAGLNRIEVTVPAHDIAHIRAIARLLREGGEKADRLRAQTGQFEETRIAKTGRDLVAILRDGAQGGFALDLPKRVAEDLRETGF